MKDALAQELDNALAIEPAAADELEPSVFAQELSVMPATLVHTYDDTIPNRRDLLAL